MSKYYNTGAPKRRVILAAQRQIQQRIRRAEFAGIRRGKKLGARQLSNSFNGLSFFKRMKIAFTGLDFTRG